MTSMLITGANRGLGLGMIKAILKLPKENVPQNIVAACRNPNEAQELQALAKDNKNIQIVQIESRDFANYPSLAQQVTDIVKDGGLDLLINNAGVGSRFHRIGMVKSEELVDTFIINTVAPIMLTKVALNAATVSMKVDLKGTGICSVVLHPGWVKTEMGGPKAPLEVDKACQRIITTINKLTEEHNGGFYDLDGKNMPW